MSEEEKDQLFSWSTEEERYRDEMIAEQEDYEFWHDEHGNELYFSEADFQTDSQYPTGVRHE